MISYKMDQQYNINHTSYYTQLPILTGEIGLTYSGHIKWIEEKFMQGLYTGKERGYVFAIDPDSLKHTSQDKKHIQYPDFNGTLIGCSLLKNSPEEKKLCCLFVDKSYRGLGVASKLIENSFTILETDKPFMTVAENNLNMLQGLIKKYNFELTSIRESVYKKGVKEYYYNER